MGVQGVEQSGLVCAGLLEAVGSREPLVDLRLLGGAVGELVEGRHGSAEGAEEPDGAWEDACGEQLDGVVSLMLFVFLLSSRPLAN
jgi:hypothetical protein